MLAGYVWMVALVAIAGFAIWLSFTKSKQPSSHFAYPGVETDMGIVVATQDERALREVLAEFGALYGAPAFEVEGVALHRADGRIVIRFPQGLRTDHFLYLVNFLHYPIKSASFAGCYGVGRVEPLAGRVVVFIPDDDEERTAVWLRTPADETWHFSFAANAALEPSLPRGPHYTEYWLP